MKRNKLMIIISILLIIVMLIGATFSFFAISTASNNDAVNTTAANFSLELQITPLYNDRALIPMDDSDVYTAVYEYNCVDIYGFGACQAYNIHLENSGDKNSYIGTIEFFVDEIENLNYLLYDEDGNIYLDKTKIVSETHQSLGDPVELDAGESKDLVLVIWLTNLPDSQEEQDADGSFSAAVTYESIYGSRVTGTFSSH